MTRRPPADRPWYRNARRTMLRPNPNKVQGPIYQHVAAKIRKKRLSLGLTQRDVAAGVGLCRRQLQAMEACNQHISLERILMLAAYFRCHYLELLEGYVPGQPIEPSDRRVPRLDVTDPVIMGADPKSPQAPDTTPVDDGKAYIELPHPSSMSASVGGD